MILGEIVFIVVFVDPGTPVAVVFFVVVVAAAQPLIRFLEWV